MTRPADNATRTLGDLVTLALHTPQLQFSYDRTHGPLPWQLTLPCVSVTDGRTRRSAFAFGATAEDAAERLQRELAGLADGMWVEVTRWRGLNQQVWSTRRVRWTGQWAPDGDWTPHPDVEAD